MFCNQCGKQLENGATFCSECGTRMEEQDQTDDKTQSLNITPEVLYCRICNAPLDEGSTFCGGCGSPIHVTQNANTNRFPQTHKEPIRKPVYQQQLPIKNKKKENLIPLIITLISVVIVSGAVIWYMLANPFENKDISVNVEDIVSSNNHSDNVIPSNQPTTSVVTAPPTSTLSPSPAVTPSSNYNANNLQMAKMALDGYMNNLVIAINAGSYSIVEPYILNGSSLYEQQTKLVSSLYSKNITEKLLSYTIIDTQWVNDTKCYFYVEEKFEITYPTKTETSTFKWKYTAQYYNGKFYMSNIEGY